MTVSMTMSMLTCQHCFVVFDKNDDMSMIFILSLYSRCVVYFGASTDIVVSFSAKLHKQYFFHQEFLIRYESILMSFGKWDIPGYFWFPFGQNVDFDIQLGLLRLDLYSLSVSGATLRTIKEGIIAIHPTVLRHGIWQKKFTNKFFEQWNWRKLLATICAMITYFRRA